MLKSKHHSLIKRMIEDGEIKQLREITEYYPITALIKHLRTNHKALTSTLNDITRIKAGTLFKIAEYFDVDPRKITDMVCNQYELEKKRKKTASRRKK